MTPVAHRMALDTTLPVAERRTRDGGGVLPLLREAHFFECTAVVPAMRELAASLRQRGVAVNGRLAFLPAPVTWLEWAENGRRGAYVLRAPHGHRVAEVWSVVVLPDGTISSSGGGHLGLHERAVGIGAASGELPWRITPGMPTAEIGRRQEMAIHADYMLYAALALVNTPRVVGRRTHAPHAGLERKLLRAHGPAGTYPLRAWSELRLEVGPPRDESASAPREAHFTGARALHFCRCHLRIRNGLLELVSAHWRGDPALGMKQTRYRLEPPRRRA